MSTPFLGQVIIASFNFAPKGYAMCNGQILPINQNQALFSLLGTIYGGDGQTNFALPNLRGRVPLHQGNGITQGQAAGEEFHTLNISELPTHTHTLQGNLSPNPADVADPAAHVFGQLTLPVYGAPTNLQAAKPDTITNLGGSQPHSNQQPYLVLNFCIALQGIFPSRN